MMINNEAKQKHQQNTLLNDNVYAGLIPRVLDYIYQINSNKSQEYNFYCSFIQIYNEKIYDLLNESKE